MTRYLVLASQTASSPELSDAIGRILQHDTDAEFVLLIPATPVEDLLEWQPDDGETVAKRTGEAARAQLEAIGARVVRVAVGDPLPSKAIEDELGRQREAYDGIIISTLPIQRSRWLALDQPRRIERRFGLPVTHVVGHSVTMSRQELIEGLNADLNLELEALLRGIYHAAAGRGMLGHELRELLREGSAVGVRACDVPGGQDRCARRRGAHPPEPSQRPGESPPTPERQHRRGAAGDHELYPAHRPGARVRGQRPRDSTGGHPLRRDRPA